MRWTRVLTICISLASCGGKAEADKPAAATKSAAGPKFDAPDGAKTAVTAAPPRAEPTRPVEGKTPDAKTPDAKTPDAKAPEEKDLGQRFRDPPWFRKTLFEDAVTSDFKRSQVDEKGMFSSQFLFDLAEGSTSDGCAQQLMDKVGVAVADLKREDTPDRITIRGATDRYTVTMVCGEAKGVMKAYVSYSWTS